MTGEQLQKVREDLIIEGLDLNHPYVEKQQNKIFELEKEKKRLGGQIQELIEIVKRYQSKINKIKEMLK